MNTVVLSRYRLIPLLIVTGLSACAGVALDEAPPDQQQTKEPLTNPAWSAFHPEKPQIVWREPSDSSRRYGRDEQRGRCGFYGKTSTGLAVAGAPPRFGSLILNDQIKLAEGEPVHLAKAPSRPCRFGQRLPSRSFPASAFAAACNEWDNWDKPAPPFHVFGNTYYVGTCGITSILIISEHGHLVIDSATESGAEMVVANIEKLGFSLRDVRYLTHTQEHFDHVGGMARLKALTGARLIASERARSVFETGITHIDDPQSDLLEPMRPVAVDLVIGDGGAIELGEQSIRATYTPGHSPGAISWRWRSCERQQCIAMVFSDGLGPVAAPEYRWADHPQYLQDYRASIDWLMNVKADLCLSAHPSQTRLITRIKANELVGSNVCRSAALGVLNRLDGIIDTQLSH